MLFKIAPLLLAFTWGVLAAAQVVPELKLPEAPAVGRGDPWSGESWHVAKIGAPSVWRRWSEGHPGTLVAVIGSGVRYDDPDLSPRLRWNTREWPFDRHDSDGNGLIDDVIGWDFVTGTALPYDFEGEGHALASLAVAARDNGVGGMGVCPRCSVLAIREAPGGVAGLRYAIEQGASIVIWPYALNAANREIQRLLERADESDVLVIAAVGDQGWDLEKKPTFPAKWDLPNVLTVTSTDSVDQLGAKANFGERLVRLAAPGVGLPVAKKAPSWDMGLTSGTAPAAAVTAGAAAVLRTLAPELTAGEIARILEATVRKVPGLQRVVRSEGVLDLESAVRCVMTPGRPCLR